MCLLAKMIPNDLRSKIMPLAFGGIALGVLIGYPFGGVAYQFIGKTAPFLLIAAFIGGTIGRFVNLSYFSIIFFCSFAGDLFSKRGTMHGESLRKMFGLVPFIEK